MAALYECDLHGCSKTVPEAEAVRAGWVSVIDCDGDGVYCCPSHAAQALGGVKAYTEERLAQLSQEATDAGYKVGEKGVNMLDTDRTEPAYAVSVTEAAELIGVSRAHAYHLAASGRLPTVRMGRRLLVPLRQLREIMDEGGA